MFALYQAIQKKFRNLERNGVSVEAYSRDWNGADWDGEFCYVCRNRECVGTCNCPKCYQEYLEENKNDSE